MSASHLRLIPFNFDLTLLFRLCEGGELFFFITKRKHLTETQAALVMRQAFYALNYLHTNRICHRYVVMRKTIPSFFASCLIFCSCFIVCVGILSQRTSSSMLLTTTRMSN